MESADRFRRLLNHFIQGTWPERLAEEKRLFLKKRRLKWWQSQQGKREFLDIEIQPSIRIRLYFDSSLSPEIYAGNFEYRELTFIRRFLKPGDRLIDIGANIGVYSLVSAGLVGDQGHVYAFEPYSRSYKRLLENVNLNKFKNVSCFQMALSDDTGESELNIATDGNDAFNSYAKPLIGQSFATEVVKKIRLDDFDAQNHLQGNIQMIKIDVEGWEVHVIQGAKEVLSGDNAPILQVEFNQNAARSAGYDCQTLYETLQEMGYGWFFYDHILNELVPEAAWKKYNYVNLLAVKSKTYVEERIQKVTDHKHGGS